MGAWSRVTTGARTTAGRARRYGEGVAVRSTRLVRPGLVPGLVSVVVPCYDVAEYLDECLTSLRFQEYRHVEIIVVDDGSPDASAEIVRAHRRRDPRVRLVRRANGGLSAARNTGIAQARGEFLTFIDADDVVQSEVFSAPVAALAESGSEFAVTCYDRIEKAARKPADRHIRDAHKKQRLAQTVETFPEIMVNAVAWSKVYRRDFWDRAGLAFPEGRLYEDQPVSMAAYARADAFDVLSVIGVSWRIRDDRSSISQATDTTHNLREHTDAVHASLESLGDAGHPRAAEERALQVLANNMPHFARHLHDADDEFWAELRRAIGELVDILPPELRARRVHSPNKMLYELVTSDRRDDARAFLTSYGTDTRRYRTWLDAEGAHCAHPLSDTVPSSCTVMSDSQVELIARALRLALSADRMLRVEGWAYIRNVDMTDHDIELQMALVDNEGDRMPVTVHTRPEPLTDVVAGHWHCDYTPGGFVATADLTTLPPGTWELTATLSVRHDPHTITRTAPVLDATIAGSGAVPRVLVHGEDHLSVDAVRRPVTVTRGPREAIKHAGRDLTRASVRHPDGTDAPVAVPTAVDCLVEDETLIVEVDGLPPGLWRPVLHQGPLAEASVRVDGTLERIGSVEGTVSGRGRIRLDLVREHWGRPGLALPSGRYEIQLLPQHDGAGTRRPPGTPLALPPEFLDRLPGYTLTRNHRATIRTTPGAPPRLALELAAPLPPDAVGERNQRLLRERHHTDHADRDGVFFRTLYGEVTNCNGLAVHEELHRRGSHLELLWSVADRSVPVPEGGVGLVEGTDEWHAAIARSRYHFINVHEVPWFTKPRGQVIVQTFHGYPYKVMGHAWWRRRAFPPSQLANYDRRARQWDYLVSPATYATPLLEAAFLEPAGADTRVLPIGYPRNDVLLSARAEKIRQRTRELLGAQPHQTVVLYAPTFRDYLSTDDMSAARVRFFDERRAAAKLGEDYLILMRGHIFNARARDRAGSSGTIIDVTDYPDINDLILASDAAVLDYSSLRFDYALTGKPMVFFVPDLEAYHRARGAGLVDYAATAPGPHVRTTGEVVDLLRDIPALAARTAPRIARFRREYADLDDGRAAGRLVDTVFG